MKPLFAFGAICCMIPLLLLIAVIVIVFTNIGEDEPPKPADAPAQGVQDASASAT